MKYWIYIILLAGFIGFLKTSSVFGMPIESVSPNQNISINIGKDFVARGVWTLPIGTNDGNYFGFQEYKDYGSTGLLKYLINGVSDEQGILEVHNEGNGLKTVLTHYQSNVGIKKIFVDYSVSTELKAPLALYEFWVADGGYFFFPKISINFPKDWKVISVWPKPTSLSPITIDYPTSTSYTRPVLVLFQPQGSSGLVKEIGRYTIAAESQLSLSKLETAIRKMTYIDEVENKTLGLSAPEHITIYSHDLSGANVGYEAVALAARPDVVIVNDEFVRTMSIGEIENVLVHEITHLVLQDQDLFSGGPFVAPWFQEGVAVFVENYAQPYIFKDEAALSKQNLVGNSHLLTPARLRQKYTKEFDYMFVGTGFLSIWSSYSHSGLVFRNFFEQKGVGGFVALFKSLKSANTSQLCVNCDSDKIVVEMMKILGAESEDAVLFPYKGDKNFDQKVSKLTTPQYDDLTTISIYKTHVENEIEKYFPVRQSVVVKSEVKPVLKVATSTVSVKSVAPILKQTTSVTSVVKPKSTVPTKVIPAVPIKVAVPTPIKKVSPVFRQTIKIPLVATTSPAKKITKPLP